jgi:hypothetical protein
MSFFEELYYWAFWYIRKIKTETDKEKADSAQILISMWQCMNVVMIFIIINAYLQIVPRRNGSIIIGIIVATMLLIRNHFYLYKRRGEIFEKYERETPQRRRMGKIIFWLYVVGTLSLLFIFVELFVTPRYK